MLTEYPRSESPPPQPKECHAAAVNPADDKWLSRKDVADRLGLPVKTLAEWATKKTGPRYAKFGKHTRYRLSDVIDWEGTCFDR